VLYLVSWPGGSWEATLKYVISVLAIYLAAIWLATIFWTYRDIRQRSRDPIVQAVAVLVVLVFFLPGLWVYQILKPRYTLAELYERSLEEEALLQELEDQKACPTCKRRVRDDYLLCPSCRTQLKEACRSCSKPLSYSWIACPYCGTEKPAQEGIGARTVRGPMGQSRGGHGGTPSQPRRPQPVAAQATRGSGLRRANPFAATPTEEPPPIDSTLD
jgi:RNA polymerase subunit RPABC4/transcription elongation factor Spt4